MRQLSVTLAAQPTASPSPHQPCLQLLASTLALTVSTGRCDVTATSLSALAHGRPVEGGPCDPLLALPLLHLPLLSTSAHANWKLPQGRDPLDHYVFPPRAPEGEVQVRRGSAEVGRGRGTHATHTEMSHTAGLGSAGLESAYAALISFHLAMGPGHQASRRLTPQPHI